MKIEIQFCRASGVLSRLPIRSWSIKECCRGWEGSSVMRKIELPNTILTKILN